jgi:hypothetical protein
MSRIPRRHPSPAMVVALIALFLSLGGVSYGLATGSIDTREIKDNNVRSRDIRNNTVRSFDLRNSSVRSWDIRNGTIRARDVGRNQLTGGNILESTLSRVPSAQSAASAGAVAGATLRKIFFATGRSETRTILDLGGLVLKARCSSGDLDGVVATTRTSGALLQGYTVKVVAGAPAFQNLVQKEPFNFGQTVTVISDSSDDHQVGQLSYALRNSSTVNVSWQTEKAAFGTCTVAGMALKG